MKKKLSSIAILPGRWLFDERTHAAMLVHLPDTDATLRLSITALDMEAHPVCTLAVQCERHRQTLQLSAALRIRHHGAGEPDLAMYLSHVIHTPDFERKVLRPFVARMQSHGMY